jgi:hypothetical protein
MAAFSIENFRSTVAETGLARKNRFEVLLAAPPRVLEGLDYSNQALSLMAESAVFPELNINAEVFSSWGPAIHRPKSINYGGFMMLAFHVDMRVKKLFDRWMQSIVDGRQYTVSYQQDYIAPFVNITQLDDQDNEVYTITLEEAFPATQTQLDLNHGIQNAFHLLQVNFRFRRWYEGEPRYGVNTNRNSLDRNSIIPTDPPNFATITGDVNQELGAGTFNSLGAGA